tara:strand:- start:5511 stop:5657 length:147 start_codon:yes stop_codon:yes gene_type:complete
MNIELMKMVILNLSEWMNTPNDELENMIGISWMEFWNLVVEIREGDEQ